MSCPRCDPPHDDDRERQVRAAWRNAFAAMEVAALDLAEVAAIATHPHDVNPAESLGKLLRLIPTLDGGSVYVLSLVADWIAFERDREPKDTPTKREARHGRP
jgi:hypothetical protein